MPKKAYVIIYHGADFLYGIGGTVRNIPRPGNHLPGGSVDASDTSPADTVVRECHEEAGVNIVKTDLVGPFTDAALPNVFFFKVQMDITTLAKKTGLTGSPADSPFTEMKIGSISAAKSGALFNATDQTDWFEAGVKAAFP